MNFDTNPIIKIVTITLIVNSILMISIIMFIATIINIVIVTIVIVLIRDTSESSCLSWSTWREETPAANTQCVEWLVRS